MSTQPGLQPVRLLSLIHRSLRDCQPDLTGATVLTEAATAAYVVTPVIAALAGADRVHAVTRGTRHGSVADVVAQTEALARLAGVWDRIEIHAERSLDLFAQADVVTNSGHLRPIDEHAVAALQPHAVVSLMFEAWEIDLGRDDVDLDALRARGIRFAGTNERHPAVGVFSHLGAMAVRMIHDGGITVRGAHLGLLCDNPFHPYLVSGLEAAGATVTPLEAGEQLDMPGELDAVVLALSPTGRSALTDGQIAALGTRTPAPVVAQFWGDLDRETCRQHGVWCLPKQEPAAGHMGVLPSAVGPEPIVRLQTGGLTVASVLRKAASDRSKIETAFLDLL